MPYARARLSEFASDNLTKLTLWQSTLVGIISNRRHLRLSHLPPSLKSILLIAHLCGSVCVMASIVHAQGVSGGDDSMLNSTPPTTGWWSSENMGPMAAPHLVIARADPAPCKAFGCSRAVAQLPSSKLYTALSEASNMNESNRYSIVRVGALVLKFDTQNTEPGFFNAGERSASSSFFEFLETKYFAWESGVADASPLVRVNQTFVHPLLEISIAGEDLPIALYVPPFLGSVPDAR